MKRIYCTHDRLLAGFIQGVLEEHGIAAWLRNDYLNGGVGELPPIECWPELWVADEDGYRALRVVDEVLRGGETERDCWRCEGCGEWLDPQFRACWRCAEPAEFEWMA